MYMDAIAIDRLRNLEICRPFISASPFGVWWLPEPFRDHSALSRSLRTRTVTECRYTKRAWIVNDFPIEIMVE
jgi:hypothetical protein